MYLFKNETSKLCYGTWREQERKGEHSFGINNKLPKLQNFNLFITFHLSYCVIIRVFAVFRIKSLLKVFKGYLFFAWLQYRQKRVLNLLP